MCWALSFSFRRLTIRGAQPSLRRFVCQRGSQRPVMGVLRALQDFLGACAISGPMLVTTRNCWSNGFSLQTEAERTTGATMPQRTGNPITISSTDEHDNNHVTGNTSHDFDLLDAAFFVHNWKLPAYSWAFLLTVMFGAFLITIWELFCLQFELFCLQLSFFAYSGKCV